MVAVLPTDAVVGVRRGGRGVAAEVALQVTPFRAKNIHFGTAN